MNLLASVQVTGMDIFNIIGLVLALAVLIVLVFKKVPIVFSVAIAALVAAVTNWSTADGASNIWGALTNFANGTGTTFYQFLFVFLLSTVYGELVAGLGMAESIANFFIKLFGKKAAAIVIVITTALLVYGGVSAMVVAFTVAPIGFSLLRQSNISKKFLPALIALGQSTFALTALPGSPQVNNIIPSSYLGTSSTAAPVLGIIAAVLMLGLGLLYLLLAIRRSKAKGETFEEELVPAAYRVGAELNRDGATAKDMNEPAAMAEGETTKEEPKKKTPNVILSFLPMFILIGCFILLENVKFGNYSFKTQYNGMGSVCTAMFIAIIYLVVYGLIAKKNKIVLGVVKKGSVDWVMPLLNFSMIVGFGTVIKALNGFQVLTNLVVNLGANYFVAAATVCILAGVTGSASGGLKIALNSEELVASWTSSNMNMGALHRVISIASGGLDSLPHCGGILADLEVCGENHSRSYFHIFVVTVLIPIFATIVVCTLASVGVVC